MKKQKRTKKIMKNKKNNEKNKNKNKKIMKGGTLFYFGDEYDDLERFHSMLGDDFDDIITWEGTFPLILATDVKTFQKYRNSVIPNSDGWIFDSWKFQGKYIDALKRVIDIWEEDNDEEKLKCAIEHVKRYQMLLHNPDLGGYFVLDGLGGPGTIATQVSSINYIKTKLLDAVWTYKIKRVSPYPCRDSSAVPQFLHNIPSNWPQSERYRRQIILQMMDLYNEFNHVVI